MYTDLLPRFIACISSWIPHSLLCVSHMHTSRRLWKASFDLAVLLSFSGIKIYLIFAQASVSFLCINDEFITGKLCKTTVYKDLL